MSENRVESEQFRLWVKGCEINHTDMYLLEGSGDTAVYKLTRQYECKHNFYNVTPVYAVWVAGKELACTTNYLDAMAVWNNHKGEGAEE